MNAQADLPWSEQFRIVAKSWVDADAAANMYEELKTANLARFMLDEGDIPVSRAEMNVKGSDAWESYIENMLAARKKATLLKVQLEYIRMKFQEWSSENATKRAEMRL